VQRFRPGGCALCRFRGQFRDVVDDVVDGLGRLAVDADDAAVHLVPGVGIGGIEGLQCIQVALEEGDVDLPGLVDGGGGEAQLRKRLCKLRQEPENLRVLLLEQLEILVVIFAVAPPQQDVFPFLHLLFECDLGGTRLVHGGDDQGVLLDGAKGRVVDAVDGEEAVPAGNCGQEQGDAGEGEKTRADVQPIEAHDVCSPLGAVAGGARNRRPYGAASRNGREPGYSPMYKIGEKHKGRGVAGGRAGKRILLDGERQPGY
jgi:hypothetical protein